jgi:capsular exopolysaccharide synthesis family protein
MQHSGSHPSQQPSSGNAGGVADSDQLELLAALRRHWWLLVVTPIVFFVGAWYLLPADVLLLEARTTVRLTDSKRALTGNLDGGLQDNLSANDFLASQVAVIRSRALIAEVVQRNGLRMEVPPELRGGLVRDVQVAPDAHPDSLRLAFSQQGFRVVGREAETTAQYGQPVEIGGVRFAVTARPAADRATIHVLPQEQAVDRLLASLRATPRPGSPVIDIAVRDMDPHRAQLAVNEITRAFHDHNARRMREQSQRRREFIEEQLAEMEARLGEAQGALAAFRSSGNLYSSRDRLLAEQSGLMNLEMRREELDVERRMLRTLLSRVERASGASSEQELRTLVASPGITANPVVSQLFNQYVQYETERKQLLADGRSPTHPDAERATRLAQSTRAEFVNAVRSHLSSLDARIASLDDLRGRNAANIRQLPAAETAETHLVQEVETVRRMADLLRDEYQRARIAEAVEVGQVEVLDFATFAAPVGGAARNQRIMLALVLGLILGGSGAIATERLNTSIRRREDLEALLHVPGLGVIPSISNGGGRRRFHLSRIPKALNGNGNGKVRQLVASSGYDSVGAEAYRVLRTNLIFSNPTQKLKSLVVTSAESGEGKTTTAANLALTLARQGMRILLIDCDLRRPQLHRVFGIDGDLGLIDVLLERASVSEATYSGGVESLSILPRGNFDSAALEVLGSPRMRSCLAECSRHYDMVILDTPPVLVAADAATIGALADGVLLVTRAGRTSRNDVRHAFQQLTAVGGHVVGWVLNDPDNTAERYGSYYRYGYAVAE